MKGNLIYQSELIELAATTIGGNQRKEFILREDCSKCVGVAIFKRDTDKFNNKLELSISDPTTTVIEATPIEMWTADTSLKNADRFLPVEILAKGTRVKLSISYDTALTATELYLVFLLEKDS